VNDEHVEEELLQRYFDGALEAPNAARVSQHIGTCASCGARHRALSNLRRAMVVAAEERAQGVDFEAMFTRIERGVREQPDQGAAGQAAVPLRDRAGRRRARTIWWPATGVVAAAAALLLFLRSAPPNESQTGAPGDGEANQGAASLTGTTNSEIEQVDFGSNAGTVFEIALSEGTSTPVVWIDDSEQTGE
jgi:anti-sigma factor RsiW